MKYRLVAAAAAVLMLSACGGGDTPAQEASAAPVGPRTIVTPFGDVTVNGVPQRVVTSGNYESDIALALGVTPVAQGQWQEVPGGAPPWRKPLIKGENPPAIKYNPDGYDVEETLSYNPDLVLNSFLVEDEVKALQPAVPTVSLGYELDSREFVLRVGDALGKKTEAEALLADIDAKLAAERAKYPALQGRTVGFGYVSEPGKIMDYSDGTTLSFVEQLGLKPAPGLAAVEDFSAVGAENFSAFDGDMLIVAYGSEDLKKQLEAEPLFQRIPAVAAGRYFGTADGDQWELLRSFSPVQMEYALTTVIPAFAALAD